MLTAVELALNLHSRGVAFSLQRVIPRQRIPVNADKRAVRFSGTWLRARITVRNWAFESRITLSPAPVLAG
jgi:hypothetical protein